MQLGIITPFTTDGLAQAAAYGLKNAEFCVNVDADIPAFLATVPALRAASEQTGVAVASLGRWGSPRLNKNGIDEAELAIDCQLIDAAAALGTPVYVAGCNYVEELSLFHNYSLAIGYFEKLLAHAGPRGVRVATYNCDWGNFVHSDPAWSVIHGHLPELGIKYDPSHSYYAGRDYLDEIARWGDRILHFHLKGALRVAGQRIDDPPAGMDDIAWPSIMALLYAKGYDGVLSIEPHSGVWQGDLGEQGIRFTREYFAPRILR